MRINDIKLTAINGVFFVPQGEHRQKYDLYAKGWNDCLKEVYRLNGHIKKFKLNGGNKNDTDN